MKIFAYFFKPTQIICTRIIKILLTLICFFQFSMVMGMETNEVCIPFGDGGAYAPGPPAWWEAPGSGWSKFNDDIDDPRWEGANSITHGEGTILENVQFRALYSPMSTDKHLYLSWWVKDGFQLGTTTDGTNNNQLWLGLRQADNADIVLKVKLNTTSNQDATSNFTTSAHTISPFGAGSRATLADITTGLASSWLDQTRIWVTSTSQGVWAIHMRVPVGINIGTTANPVTLGTDFKLWYSLMLTSPGSSGEPGQGDIVQYHWPRSTDFEVFNVNVGAENSISSSSNWPAYHMRPNPNTDSICATGISIQSVDISATHEGAATTNTIHKTKTNTFTATPHNNTGAAIDANKLHARFRIAGWGNQPETAAWNSLTGFDDVTQSSGSISDLGNWTIAKDWACSGPGLSLIEQQICNGTLRAHQCIQVELSGPGLKFLQSSAFRNMRMVPASIFSEPAIVNVKGLPDIDRENHDVFLYVKTKNMPVVDFRGPLDEPDIKLGHQLAVESTIKRTSAATQNVSQIQKTRNKEPRYTVHAFYDSGRTMTLNGQKKKILRPMVSYGYEIQHKEDLAGWTHTLEGAEKLGENWYRIAVPKNSQSTVRNTIEAIEPKKYSAAFHFGYAVPHSSFANLYDTDMSFVVDFEYRYSNTYAITVNGAKDNFKGTGGTKDLKITRYGVNVKPYLNNGAKRLFVTAGIGSYKLDPGQTRTGINAGLGYQYNINPDFGIEASYNYHKINNNSPIEKYSTIQAALRLRF